MSLRIATMTESSNRLAALHQKVKDSVRSTLRRFEVKPDPAWGVAAQAWANPKWAAFCLGVLMVTVFHPPEGLPFRFCFFYQLFHADCPGCGMTRGLTNIWHGDWGRAIGFHPFAPLAFGYLIFQSSFLFLSRKMRSGVIYFLDRHEKGLRKVAMGGFVLFLVHGFCRAGVEIILNR